MNDQYVKYEADCTNYNALIAKAKDLRVVADQAQKDADKARHTSLQADTDAELALGLVRQLEVDIRKSFIPVELGSRPYVPHDYVTANSSPSYYGVSPQTATSPFPSNYVGDVSALRTGDTTTANPQPVYPATPLPPAALEG
jgi:hypothetical protein